MRLVEARVQNYRSIRDTVPNPTTLVVSAHKARHLSDALESVVCQTTRDFDVVLVADELGESEVMDEMRRFGASWRQSGCQVLSVVGGSAGAVRNAGVQASTTPWVTYLDGDDVLHPDAMSVASRVALADLADVVTTGMWHIDDEGVERSVPESLSYRPSGDLLRVDPDLSGDRAFLHQLLFFKKSAWMRYPYYEGEPGEDLDFMLHHLAMSRVRKLPKALYGHRRVPDGFSQRAARTAAGECDCRCSRRYRTGHYEALLASIAPAAASNFGPQFVLEGW